MRERKEGLDEMPRKTSGHIVGQGFRRAVVVAYPERLDKGYNDSLGKK